LKRKEVVLRVAEAKHKDAGRHKVRIDEKYMKILGVSKGDIVEIEGKKLTAAFVLPAYPEDRGTDIIRMDGIIRRNAEARLLRDNVVVHKGKIASLKRFKDDVREVQAGYECGIGFERFNDIKAGDVIEAYEMEEMAPDLGVSVADQEARDAKAEKKS